MKNLFKSFCSVSLVAILMFCLCTTAFAIDEDYMAEHGEEGQALWEDFLKYVDMYPDVFIGQPYDTLYNGYTYRDGREMDDMTEKDMWLWNNTVLFFFNANPDSWDSWGNVSLDSVNSLKNYFRINYNDVNKDDVQLVIDSYKALSSWEWDYYNSTGRFYNFIENKDSLDYMNEHFGEEDVSDSDVSDTKDTESIESVISSSVESNSGINSSMISSAVSSSASLSSSRTGAWTRVTTSLKNSIFTIVIAIVLVGILAFLAYRRKKYNMGNNDD